MSENTPRESSTYVRVKAKAKVVVRVKAVVIVKVVSVVCVVVGGAVGQVIARGAVSRVGPIRAAAGRNTIDGIHDEGDVVGANVADAIVVVGGRGCTTARKHEVSHR